MNKEFCIAKSKFDHKIIADLATVIWREYYTPIIGSDQVAYMLEKFQSTDAIKQQIVDGYSYVIFYFDMNPVGYLSFTRKQASIFLSKIYVLKFFRGQGVGRFAMDFIESKALDLKSSKITLTVNKNNADSIKAYEKMGFEKIKSIVTDIGGGFVMDDYEMVKII